MAAPKKKIDPLKNRSERQAMAKKSQKNALPKILTILVLLFAALSIFYFINQEKEYKKQQILNAQYTETLASLEEENTQLEKDKENINSDENVAKIAHEQGMIKEGEVIFEDADGN